MSKVKVLTAIAGVALAVSPIAVVAATSGHSAAGASRPAAVSAAAQPAGGPVPTATPTPTPTSSTGSNDDTPWG